MFNPIGDQAVGVLNNMIIEVRGCGCRHSQAARLHLNGLVTALANRLPMCQRDEILISWAEISAGRREGDTIGPTHDLGQCTARHWHPGPACGSHHLDSPAALSGLVAQQMQGVTNAQTRTQLQQA